MKKLSSKIIANLKGGFLCAPLIKLHKKGMYKDVIESISHQLHCPELEKYIINLSSELRDELEDYEIEKQDKH